MAIVVKNTFLAVERNCVEKRSSSIPRSFKPSVFVEQPHSITASTLKPLVFAEQPHSSTASTEPESQHTIIGSEASVLRNNSVWPDMFGAGIPDSPTRSKSKAISKFEWERSMRFKYDLAKTIKRSIKLLSSSELIANVQTSENSRGCLLTVQTSVAGEVQKEQVQKLVQEALLDGAVPSKSIYIIGFRAPFPFIPTEFGFDFKFGAMENAKTACWYFFKKGFCRHGDQCAKQHVIWEMPTRVRIEAAPNKSLESSVCSGTRVGIEASPIYAAECSASFEMKEEM